MKVGDITTGWSALTVKTVLKKKKVWIPIVVVVALITLVGSMYAYTDSLRIVGWFSTHPQSTVDAYVGGVELEGLGWFWWRFLTITAVEFDNSYYRATDTWVVPPGVNSGLGVVSAENAANLLNGIDLSPAVGYRMQAPKVQVAIRIERYRACTENLNHTEVPLGIGIRTRLFWIERNIFANERPTYDNIGTY